MRTILDANSKDQLPRTMEELAEVAVNTLQGPLEVEKVRIFCFAIPIDDSEQFLTSCIVDAGNFVFHPNNLETESGISPEMAERLNEVIRTQKCLHFDDAFAAVKRGHDDQHDNIVYLEFGANIDHETRSLIAIYVKNVVANLEKINLQRMLRETQHELVYLLGEAVEARSKETGAHVKRVALCSAKLAELAGQETDYIDRIVLASPLHDVGKVAIPDEILHKNGLLTESEWDIMKRHAEFGYDILKKSASPVMRMGAIIAKTHHEKWDGSGYPRGLKGVEIPLEGRITALVDVFDALGSKRAYKEAWNLDAICQTLLDASGTHFDPALVQLFIANIDSFNAIREQFPDPIHAEAL